MHEIIVYRNPLEADFWHMVGDGQFFPVIVGVVAFFAVFLTLNAVVPRLLRGSNVTRRFFFKNEAALTYGELAFGAVAGVATTMHLFV